MLRGHGTDHYPTLPEIIITFLCISGFNLPNISSFSLIPCRTFLGMEVCCSQAHLLELVRVVDRTMTEFHLDTFYKVRHQKKCCLT